MRSKKYLLVQHLILLLILGMSMIVVRGNISVMNGPIRIHDDVYYTINILNTTYADIDSDGHSDTVYLHLQIAGAPNKEVNVGVNITEYWDKPIYFPDSHVYSIQLDNTGYGYFDYNMTASATTTYDIFFMVKDPDTGEYLTSTIFTVYLDGLFKDWIPKPEIEVSINHGLQDIDNDGYGDRAVFHFQIQDLSDPLYMDSIKVRYDLFGQIGDAYHFDERDVYAGEFQKIDENGTFEFDVYVQFNITANYMFYFYFYDEYNRYISDEWDYLGRVDGYGDKYFAHTVEGGLQTVYTTTISGDFIDAINVSSWLNYSPGGIPPAENYLNITIRVWNIKNGVYLYGENDYILGEDSYLYNKISFNVFINDTSFSIVNKTIFNLTVAGKYFVVYTVTDFNGFVWINDTAEVVALVGVRPGDEPLILQETKVNGTDINRDGNEDGLMFNATIESDLIMNYTVHVVLEVQKIETNGTPSFKDAIVYYNDKLLEVNSPVVFNVSDFFQSHEEAYYRITWWLFYDDYEFNCSLLLFNDTMHLYSSEEVTTTTSTNANTTSTTSTTSTISSTSDNSSSSSSEEISDVTTIEPTNSSESSESPQLPLPFPFTGFITGLLSSTILAVFFKKRVK